MQGTSSKDWQLNPATSEKLGHHNSEGLYHRKKQMKCNLGDSPSKLWWKTTDGSFQARSY